MRLDFQRAGEGRSAILLPPFPFDEEAYSPQLRLAGDGRLALDLIAARFPGFGGTPLPRFHPPVLLVSDLASQVLDLADELSLDKPVLVGCGLGGYVALEAVARRPHAAGPAIVIGCKLGRDGTDRRADRFEAAAYALDEGADAYAHRYAVAALASPNRERCRPEALRMASRADPRAIAGAIWGVHLRRDPGEYLESLVGSVTVAVGDQDPVCLPADAERLATALGTPLRRLRDSGHAAPLEVPDAITDLLMELA